MTTINCQNKSSYGFCQNSCEDSFWTQCTKAAYDPFSQLPSPHPVHVTDMRATFQGLLLQKKTREIAITNHLYLQSWQRVVTINLEGEGKVLQSHLGLPSSETSQCKASETGMSREMVEMAWKGVIWQSTQAATSVERSPGIIESQLPLDNTCAPLSRGNHAMGHVNRSHSPMYSPHHQLSLHLH